MLISIETHITCDFPGGGGSGPPIPLWICTWKQSVTVRHQIGKKAAIENDEKVQLWVGQLAKHPLPSIFC